MLYLAGYNMESDPQIVKLLFMERAKHEVIFISRINYNYISTKGMKFLPLRASLRTQQSACHRDDMNCKGRCRVIKN